MDLKTSEPDWFPFDVILDGSRGASPRSMQSIEGIGDRMRSAAFAEIQAREGFRWACQHFPELPQTIRDSWLRFADVEDRHLHLLLVRMQELGIDVRERQVSNRLWLSFQECQTPREFAEFMINAEERGRLAGLRFVESLQKSDPISAQVVQTIADEEVEHIETVKEFYNLELKPQNISKPEITKMSAGLSESPITLS